MSPVGKGKVYGGNDLPKSQVLSAEWKTERAREDASGDSEDGEEDDDELPCVIGNFSSYSFPVPGGNLCPLLGYFHHGADLFVISK